MSCKVICTCDHCGKEVSPYIGKQWKAGFLTVGPSIDDIYACSKEHLTLALAKTFDIPLDASTLRIVTEKNDALNAARAAIVECDNMRAQIAELEARMPANEVTNVERAQYDRTIELQRKRIEELETSEAALTERLTRIEGPAQRLVDIDNNLAEGRDVAAKALFHDSVMRPIEELRGYFGNVARAEKRGQTIFEWEVERRKRVEKSRDELQARVAELEKRIAELTAPMAVDGKTPGQIFGSVFFVGGAEIWPKTGLETRAQIEAGANAVLRAFLSPRQTQQDAVDALRRVRERIEECRQFVVKDDDATFSAIARKPVMLAFSDELAKLEAKPTTTSPLQYANEVARYGTEVYARAGLIRNDAGSPPDTSTESGLPDAVLAAITLPTKPTKPLRERLEELATYWEKGAASSSMSEGYRQASKDCAKELREVIDDPR